MSSSETECTDKDDIKSSKTNKFNIKKIKDIKQMEPPLIHEYIEDLHAVIKKHEKKLKKYKDKILKLIKQIDELKEHSKCPTSDSKVVEVTSETKTNRNVNFDENLKSTEDEEKETYFNMLHCNRSNCSLSISSSRSSLCQEDYDVFVDDVTYEFSLDSPKDVSDVSDDNQKEEMLNSKAVFRPISENYQCESPITMVQAVLEDVDVYNSEEASVTLSTDVQPDVSTSNSEPRLNDFQDGTTTSKMSSSFPKKISRKRLKQPEKWKKNIIKHKRNSGKEYESYTHSKKIIPERQMKTPCTEICRLECYKKFSEDERKELFTSYWNLGDIEKQRQYIDNSMEIIEPRYRYVHIGGPKGPRQNNNAFFFKQADNIVRVCKLFFKNTLDISDRVIRTVLEKRQKLANEMLEPDQRGKHGNQKKMDPNLKAGVKKFIEKKTSKAFIEGRKTITSIYKDYIDLCKEKNDPYCSYISFYRSFTEECNI